MKKKNLKNLSLKKKTIVNLGNQELIGGRATDVGTCQTTSCVCTDNYPCRPSYGQPCGSGQMMCNLQNER